jgi:FSR family fosmidomycin resistance protein-like MFS transporter
VLRPLLYTAALLDELTSGFFVVGLPLLRDRFHLSYEQAGLLFSVGAFASLVLEPGINLLSDRGTKRAFVAGGMTIMAASMLLAGVAPTYPLLLLAIAVLFPANGAAVGLAQAALVDLRPDSAAVPHTLARWTLLSGVGDLLAPLAVTAFVAAGLGWTPLCLLAAALWALAALLTWPQRFARSAPEASDDDEAAQAPAGLLARVRAAVRNPLLLRWTAVDLLAGALDEVYIGFAALYLRDDLHVSVAATEFCLIAFMIGGLLGLVALDRALRTVPGPRLLPPVLLVTAAGVAGFLLAPNAVLAALALFVTGLTAVCWYPIAKAAAYAALPGQTGTVLSVAALGAPFETVLPGFVGFLAGSLGLSVGLGFLGLAPLAALLLLPRRTSPRTGLTSLPAAGSDSTREGQRSVR